MWGCHCGWDPSSTNTQTHPQEESPTRTNTITPTITHTPTPTYTTSPKLESRKFQKFEGSSGGNFKIRNKSLSSTCMVLSGPKVNHIQSIQPSFIWSGNIGYYNYWRFNPCWNSYVYDLCWISIKTNRFFY